MRPASTNTNTHAKASTNFLKEFHPAGIDLGDKELIKISENRVRQLDSIRREYDGWDGTVESCR